MPGSALPVSSMQTPSRSSKWQKQHLFQPAAFRQVETSAVLAAGAVPCEMHQLLGG